MTEPAGTEARTEAPQGPTWRRRPGAMEARLGAEELVLLGPDGARYVALDPVAADVWAALEVPRSRAALAAHLAGIYDAPAAQIAEDIGEMLALLEAEGLIEQAEAG